MQLVLAAFAAFGAFGALAAGNFAYRQPCCSWAVFVPAIIMTSFFFFFSFALLSASRFAFFSILFLGFGQELVQLEPGLKLSKQKLCFVATVNMQRTKCSQTN